MDVLAIVLSIVGTVVLVGLGTLLLWRLYTYLADRREYAKFELELEEMKGTATENELYRDPVTRYRVPDSMKETLAEIED